MKEFWLNKNECTGCGACTNICPKNAIKMEIDCSGFCYPVIGPSCVDCNLCEKVCLLRESNLNQRLFTPITYAVWSNNSNIRYESTSGGAFSELSKVVLSKGGYIAGAQYNENNLVQHVIVSDEEGLERIRQSKYIQSDMGYTYTQILKILQTGKLVAFCGAPCQIAALYAYLGKDYENLVTFDFICRGMNSPKAYKAWLCEIENIEKCKISRVWFKYKEGGWNSSPKRTRIDFSDGHYIIKEGKKNLFMQGYLSSNLYIRPCCGSCKFKGIPRQGDITLADFWGIDKSLDDDKGTSMVLINSLKGKQLFEEAKGMLTFFERSFNEIILGNTCFNNSVDIPKQSNDFLKDLDKEIFSKALKKYTRILMWNKVWRKGKNILRLNYSKRQK